MSSGICFHWVRTVLHHSNKAIQIKSLQPPWKALTQLLPSSQLLGGRPWDWRGTLVSWWHSLALSFSSGDRSATFSCENCNGDSSKNMLGWKMDQDFSTKMFSFGKCWYSSCDQEMKITPVSSTFFHPKSPSLGSLQVKVFENWDTQVSISALWQQPTCSWLFEHEWVSLSAVLCTKILKSTSFSHGMENGSTLLSWVCFASCWQLEGQPLCGAARSDCGTTTGWLLWTDQGLFCKNICNEGW